MFIEVSGNGCWSRPGLLEIEAVLPTEQLTFSEVGKFLGGGGGFRGSCLDRVEWVSEVMLFDLATVGCSDCRNDVRPMVAACSELVFLISLGDVSFDIKEEGLVFAIDDAAAIAVDEEELFKSFHRFLGTWLDSWLFLDTGWWCCCNGS